MGRPREFDMDQALNAAMTAFWTHGYEATSMADLMKVMNLQKGSIYKAFHDKHDLYMQALNRYLDNGLKTMKQGIGKATSPKEGIRFWLKEMIFGLCHRQDKQRGLSGSEFDCRIRTARSGSKRTDTAAAWANG